MSNNTTCPIYSPYPACSHHGKCDESSGTCFCDDGWSAIGDFAFVDGVDCNITIEGVKILHGIMILVSVVVIFQCMRCIRNQIESFRMKHKSKQSYFSNPTRLFPLWGLIMALTALIIGIYRIARPFEVVGRDVFVTILVTFRQSCWMFGVTDFNWVTLHFLYEQLSFAPKAESYRVKEEIRMYLKLAPTFKFLAVLSCLIPFLCFAYPNEVFVIASAHHLACCVWNYAIAIPVALHSLHTMIRLLAKHLEESKHDLQGKRADMELFLMKLKRARCIFAFIMPGPGVAWILVSLTPGLSRQSIYVIIYLILNALFSTYRGVDLIIKNSSANKPTPQTSPTEEMQVNIANITTPRSDMQ